MHKIINLHNGKILSFLSRMLKAFSICGALFICVSFSYAQNIKVYNPYSLNVGAVEAFVLDKAEGNENVQVERTAAHLEDWLYRMEFLWPEGSEVGAAAVRRGNKIFVIFDDEVALEKEFILGQSKPFVEDIVLIPSSSGTVFQLSTLADFYPRMQRDGAKWYFDLLDKEPDTNIQYATEDANQIENKVAINFADDNPGKVVGFLGPLGEHTILVGTSRTSFLGVQKNRQYSGFKILESIQGLMIESLKSDLNLRSFDRGFILSADSNLPISNIFSTNIIGENSFSDQRIFNWQRWYGDSGDNFLDKRAELILAASRAKSDTRNAARTDVIRFFLSNELAQEAIGIFNLIKREHPFFTDLPELYAIQGAAYLMAHRYSEAENIFSSVSLATFKESLLWLGLAMSSQGEYQLAEEQFEISEGILLSYPAHLQMRFGLVRVNNALKVNKLSIAREWIETLESLEGDFRITQKELLELYKANFNRRNGNPEHARTIYKSLEYATNRMVRVSAQFELTKLDILEEKMHHRDAIEKLLKLRYGWRGDQLEMEIIIFLSRMYFAAKEYRKGFKLLYAGVSYLSNKSLSVKATDLMENEFISLFFEGKADELNPIYALSLYDEFRELTPSGIIGNFIVEKIASRLIEIDLLDRAQDLLEYQVRFRLDGSERARVGTKVAVLKLLSRDPEGAIVILSETRYPGISRELSDERRRLLAKALVELERYDEAERLLTGDASVSADNLRLSIFWNLQQWAYASETLRRLVGDPLKDNDVLSENQARNILNWAVAMKLNEDELGLSLARKKYLEAMNNTYYKDLFLSLTSDRESDVNITLGSSLLQQISGNSFNKFLDDYRLRIANPNEEFLGLPNQLLQSAIIESEKIKLDNGDNTAPPDDDNQTEIEEAVKTEILDE